MDVGIPPIVPSIGSILTGNCQAVIETDMPNARALNSVQSAHHGLVLWCPIDGGRTRLGFVFSPELQEKYGPDGVTQEVAMEVCSFHTLYESRT